jgi:hypothetical protein
VLTEKGKSMRKRIVGTLSLATAVLAATGVAVASSVGEDPGCEAFSGSIQESKEFTPFEARRSQLPDSLLNAEGESVTRPPDNVAVDSIAGLSRQWTLVASDGSATQYFSKGPVDKMSLWEFQGDGGIQLDTVPAKVASMSVKELAEFLGDRANPVTVGSSEGIVVWADPESPNDQRLHHVYWESDDGTQYALMGDLSAEDAVTEAREVACR